MQRKITKQVCFLTATIFLLVFIVFNSCKKVHPTNGNSVIPPVDTAKNSNDSIQSDTSITDKVYVTGKLVDTSGKALSNVNYIVLKTGFPQIAIGGSITDSSGKIVMLLDKNGTYILDVYQSLTSGSSVYSKDFTALNKDIDLGNIVIQTRSVSLAATGTFTDCYNNSVKSGKVILEEYNFLDRLQYESSFASDGAFKVRFTVCKADSVPIIIYAQDANGLQIGNRMYFSLASNDNNLGEITACKNSDTAQFINLTVDSTQYSLSSPENPNDHPENPFWTYIEASNTKPGQPDLYFGIDGSLAVGKPGLSLVEFDIGYELSESGETKPTINISEDGPIGGYIAGNIKLKVESTNHSQHDATCSFRVKRQQ